MSLETVSTRRERVYKRAFDHDEARRLHAAGWSVKRLAEHFGVSDTGVRRVLDPVFAARMQRNTNAYTARAWKKPCKGGCGGLVWMHPGSNPSGYCRACYVARRAAARGDVREGELRCVACGEWKPDADFTTRRPPHGRRGRDSRCRECQTKARRDYRHAHADEERITNNNYRRRMKGSEMQRYIVLQPDPEETGVYREFATTEAVSAIHAIETAATGPGTYIAVVESKFKPMRVAPVQAFRVQPEIAAVAEDAA